VICCSPSGNLIRAFPSFGTGELRLVIGADHPDTLATRANIAGWTGEYGDAREALRLSQALLSDQTRVLGADHPDTLATRSRIQDLQETQRSD
jgi:hypothetical protein